MIGFRAICLGLFPETVLQETPWEWDTLHQQLPLGEKHSQYQCSGLRRGPVSMLGVAGFNADYQKNHNTEKQTANSRLSGMANYKECKSRRLKGIRQIWINNNCLLTRHFICSVWFCFSQLHISQHNGCNHPLHCLPLVSHCKYYKIIRFQTCRAAKEFLQKELRTGKTHDLY